MIHLKLGSLMSASSLLVAVFLGHVTETFAGDAQTQAREILRGTVAPRAEPVARSDSVLDVRVPESEGDAQLSARLLLQSRPGPDGRQTREGARKLEVTLAPSFHGKRGGRDGANVQEQARRLIQSGAA